MSEQQSPTPAITPNDIIFDCPHCSKSLAIDQRGAGLVVTCPDCNQPVQVPGLPPEVRRNVPHISSSADEALQRPTGQKNVAELEEALAAAHQKIARLVESLEEIRERRRVLEQLRADNMARLRQIGKELETIQHAIDRIVAHLQDADAQDTSAAAQ